MDKTIGLILNTYMQLPHVACVYKDIYVKEHGQFGFAADKFRLCCVEQASKAEAKRSPLKCFFFSQCSACSAFTANAYILLEA